METVEELGRALGTVSIDSEALIARAVTRGRRLQRRRRIGAGAGVAALVVVAASPALVRLGGDDGHAGAFDHTSGGPTLPTPQQTDARLAARLPVPGDPVSATSDHGVVSVVRTLDPDGSGRGSVSLALQISTPMGPGEVADTARKCTELALGPGGDSCKKVLGGWVFSEILPVRPGQTRALNWVATMVGNDGTSVAVRATNYVRHGAPTRPAPVLDADQLGHLAVDPVWFEPGS
jgi:hypothetical protein